MRICDEYDHFQALSVICDKGHIRTEITNVLEDRGLLFGRSRPQEIRAKIAEGFNRMGWADKVRVNRSSNLTVSFMKDRVGVCLQLGNIARVYADILKLLLLGKKDSIDVGVIIVPDKPESKLLGANYARFDRVTREIQEFAEIVDIPILVISLSN